jgi:hypothetical protein
MRTNTYIIEDTVVEISDDGSTLTIRQATENERNAVAVGSFSYKIGHCRVRVSQDRGIAKIKDGTNAG